MNEKMVKKIRKFIKDENPELDLREVKYIYPSNNPTQRVLNPATYKGRYRALKKQERSTTR